MFWVQGEEVIWGLGVPYIEEAGLEGGFGEEVEVDLGLLGVGGLGIDGAGVAVGAFVGDDFGIGGVGEGFGEVEGVVEGAGLVDKAEGDGFVAGEDSAIGDGGEFVVVEVAGVFDDAFEAGEVVIDHVLHDGFFFGGDGFEHGGHVFHGAGLDGVVFDADEGHGARDFDGMEDDADGADDGGGLGDDFVGGAGGVVGAGGEEVLAVGDDGFVGFGFEAEDFLVESFGGGDGSSRGVDAEEDGFDGGIVGGEVELLGKKGDRVFGGLEKTGR